MPTLWFCLIFTIYLLIEFYPETLISPIAWLHEWLLGIWHKLRSLRLHSYAKSEYKALLECAPELSSTYFMPLDQVHQLLEQYKEDLLDQFERDYQATLPPPPEPLSLP
jgi:hypothetical protein